MEKGREVTVYAVLYFLLYKSAAKQTVSSLCHELSHEVRSFNCSGMHMQGHIMDTMTPYVSLVTVFIQFGLARFDEVVIHEDLSFRKAQHSLLARTRIWPYSGNENEMKHLHGHSEDINRYVHSRAYNKAWVEKW